jgi:hypothetical protein
MIGCEDAIPHLIMSGIDRYMHAIIEMPVETSKCCDSTDTAALDKVSTNRWVWIPLPRADICRLLSIHSFVLLIIQLSSAAYSRCT